VQDALLLERESTLSLIPETVCASGPLLSVSYLFHCSLPACASASSLTRASGKAQKDHRQSHSWYQLTEEALSGTGDFGLHLRMSSLSEGR
jgi:hypothetical protein